MRILTTAAATLGLALCGQFAFAQTLVPAGPAAPLTKIRGSVASIGGGTLTVTSNAGQTVAVALPPDTTIVALTAGTLDQVKPGSFIGTAARSQPDGTLQAIEVQVFPESMRGAGAGSHPYDLGAGSSMTNGTVGQLVGTSGRTMTVTFPGGERTVVVPPDAPVVDFAPGTAAQLTPGAHVIVNAGPGGAGALSAKFVLVGLNGLVPPL